MLGPDFVSQDNMLDLLIKGDLLMSELFFALEPLIGERLVLIRAELFYDNCFEDKSFWDLKNISAGVVAFFFEDEKSLSV